MNENMSESNRVKCPFCAELILPEAKICRFCKSDLAKNVSAAEKTEDKKNQPPTLGRALILNLVCPGLGAWRLGHRIRGAIIFCLVISFMLFYANEIMPIINKAVNTAVRTGNMTRLNRLSQDLEQNHWLDWSLYIYLYSFIELFFLIKKNNPSTKQE